MSAAAKCVNQSCEMARTRAKELDAFNPFMHLISNLRNCASVEVRSLVGAGSHQQTAVAAALDGERGGGAVALRNQGFGARLRDTDSNLFDVLNASGSDPAAYTAYNRQKRDILSRAPGSRQIRSAC